MADSEILQALRSKAETAAYVPAAPCPHWLNALADAAVNDAGTLALIGPAGVNVSDDHDWRQRVDLEPCALMLCAVARRAELQRSKIALGCLPVARHIPLVIATASLLARAVTDGGADAAKQHRPVLLVSPDLDLRSRYCDVFVGNVRLDDAYAGSRMLADGQRVRLRANTTDAADGICFFLPGLELPSRLTFVPRIVILDLRYAAWTRRAMALSKWSAALNCPVVALHTMGDVDSIRPLLEAGFLQFPFDHTAIRSISAAMPLRRLEQSALTVDWWTPNHLLARTHTIREIVSPGTTKIVGDLNRLTNEPDIQSAPDAQRAKWILSTLTQMPVPLTWYDQAAHSLGRSPLRRLIDQLGYRDGNIKGVAPLLQTIRMQLQVLLNQIENENPRSELLREVLPPIASASDVTSCLLLVRDAVMERATHNWLTLDLFRDADWMRNVDIRACSRMVDAAGRFYPAALVNGAFPRRYRWLAGAALGGRVDFLACPSESDVIQFQLERSYGPQTVAELSEMRERVRKHLKLTSNKPIGPEREIERLVLKRPAVAKVVQKRSSKTAVKIGDLRDLAGAISSVARETDHRAQVDLLAILPAEPPSEDAAIDEPTLASVPPTGDTTCVRTEVRSKFFGEGILLLDVNTLVDCVRSASPDDLSRVEPLSVEPGDVLLRIDDDGRDSLFERVLQIAEEQPRMRHLGAFRQLWREALRRLSVSFRVGKEVDYAALLKALQTEGATIKSELAVRFWVRGLVIGPETIGSIRAVGRAAGMESLANAARDFDAAFRQIRAIHQAMGRRLMSAIRRAFSRTYAGEPGQPIDRLDDRLSIPIDELIEASDLCEVESIDKRPVRVPGSFVGRFLRK